jgi:hypothetical protein
MNAASKPIAVTAGSQPGADMNHANAPSKAVNVKYLSIKVFILMHYIT